MKKTDNFTDPLQDIDPIMEEVFFSEENTKTEDLAENTKPAGEHNISQIQFPVLDNLVTGKKVEEDIFGNIPINVSVELGRSEMSLKEIYELSEGSIIELERLVGEPLDLVVNGQIIAQGEVVAVDNNYGLRLTNIIAKNPS